MLRRYAPLKPSRGTVIPEDVRREVYALDGGCAGPNAGLPGSCDGPLELDHVRSSGALGRKSESSVGNLVTLCRFIHHRWKTENGKVARPLLLDWIARRSGECTHVEPVHGCPSCRRHSDPMQLGATGS